MNLASAMSFSPRRTFLGPFIPVAIAAGLFSHTLESPAYADCSTCVHYAHLEDPVAGTPIEHFYHTEECFNNGYDALLEGADSYTTLVTAGPYMQDGVETWRITETHTTFNITTVTSMSEACYKTDGRPKPEDPGNDAGSTTEKTPVNPPPQCSTCGGGKISDGSTP